MRVLITGGTGFVGFHLSTHLRQAGAEVVVTGGPSKEAPASPIPDGAQLFPLDIADPVMTERLVTEVKPDHIYHLAAQSSVARSFDCPAETMTININGTVNLLEAVSKSVPQARILVVGSAEVYGAVPPDSNPIREEQPFNPMSPYAVSKVGQDMAALFYARSHGLNIVRVRPFNHLGPWQRPDFAVSDFARQIAGIENGEREPVIWVGNLDAQRDFTDVRDTVAAYALLMQHGVAGEVYNVCSGQPVSIGDILRLMLAQTEAKVQIRVDPARLRLADPPTVFGDCSKLIAATGWSREFSLAQTVGDVLEYWRTRLDF